MSKHNLILQMLGTTLDAIPGVRSGKRGRSRYRLTTVWCMDRLVGSEKLGRVEDRILS